MATQEKINSHGRKYIRELQDIARQCWEKACEEDNIPTNSNFVCFSPDNKWDARYNRVMTEIQNAEMAYRAGGYVELCIKGGNAVIL